MLGLALLGFVLIAMALFALGVTAEKRFQPVFKRTLS
jgi:hypothetical protein